MRRPAEVSVKAVALILAASSLLVAAVAQERSGSGREAILLDVTGAIGPATTEYLRQGFEAAADRKAGLIVLRMDTPGGLDTATREIIRDILASPVPIVTYVSPSGARAASAGTYILYASHLAAMAPGTNLGAATPVQLGGGCHRAAEAIAARTIRAGKEDSGRRHGATRRSTTLPPISGGSPNCTAATRNGPRQRCARQRASRPERRSKRASIEIVASDLDDVLRQAHGRSVRLLQQKVQLDTAGLAVVPIEPNWRTRLLAVITNPNIAFILMIVGIYGIIFRVHEPRHHLLGRDRRDLPHDRPVRPQSAAG